MVSTRGHPAAFPETPTPASRTTSPATTTVTRSTSKRASARSPSTATSPATLSASESWSHTPSHLTLIWMAMSLPLVIWDTGYVLLRPHSMPGGAYHSPIWTPYALYSTVDYIYGWPAYDAHNGFTAAQGALNAVETLGYLYYLWIVYTKGHETAAKKKGRGAPRRDGFFGQMKGVGTLIQPRILRGSDAGSATLIAFSMAVMTLSKTVLYWANEYFSGFENIGHNDFWSLLTLWIIPNGLWLVFPTYMIYVFGQEILEGLETAAEGGKKKR